MNEEMELEVEEEMDEEAEDTAEEKGPDLKDVVDALHNRSEAYDKLTASWVRSQLRKGNETLMASFSQDSNRRWVIDVDLDDATDAVAAAWDNRRKRGAAPAETSEDADLSSDDEDMEEDEE